MRPSIDAIAKTVALQAATLTERDLLLLILRVLLADAEEKA